MTTINLDKLVFSGYITREDCYTALACCKKLQRGEALTGKQDALLQRILNSQSRQPVKYTISAA